MHLKLSMWSANENCAVFNPIYFVEKLGEMVKLNFFSNPLLFRTSEDDEMNLFNFRCS